MGIHQNEGTTSQWWRNIGGRGQIQGIFFYRRSSLLFLLLFKTFEADLKYIIDSAQQPAHGCNNTLAYLYPLRLFTMLFTTSKRCRATCMCSV